MRNRRIRGLVAIIPYFLIPLLPLVNKVYPKVFGVPFLWFWSFIYAVYIAVSVWLLYRMEGMKHE